MEWRTIDSAPKDGTWILAIVAGDWKPGVPYAPNVVKWGTSADWGGWPSGWLAEDDGELIAAHFTHWMPLPNPPATEA